MGHPIVNVHGSAKLVRDACAKLIAAAERQDDGAEDLWRMVAAGNPELKRESIRSLASSLRDRTDKLDQLVMKADFRKIKIGDARTKLIERLAEHFRDKGLAPEVGVNYEPDAPPSPFIALVILIMASLPEGLHEPIQGLPALSREVSRATTAFRTARERPKGAAKR
jgi:hypothetical protein